MTAREARFLRFGLAIELSLVIVAWTIGRLIGFDPLQHLHWSPRGLAIGALAAAPLFVGLWILDRIPLRPLERIERLIDAWIARNLRRESLVAPALLSIAAGLGEEALFRGLLQDGLASLFGLPIALGVASAIFGLAHAITPTYAVIAGLIGLYLGGLYVLTADLAAPIAAHALYDFAALVYFLRSAPKDTIEETNSSGTESELEFEPDPRLEPQSDPERDLDSPTAVGRPDVDPPKPTDDPNSPTS